MSESLRNDGRVWVPEDKGRQPRAQRHPRSRSEIISSSAAIRASATSCRATWPRAPPRRSATRAAASGRAVTAFISTSATPSSGRGSTRSREKYGNLFEIYERITGENAYEVPMRIYPAVHYTMGGLWVDYQLMSNIPGLFVAGEANFSDQGANRLGASALMQGLADGYFILPATRAQLPGLDAARKGRYLAPRVPAGRGRGSVTRIDALLNDQGKRTVDSIHRELGKLMWDDCGMSRSEESLRHAPGARSPSSARSSARMCACWGPAKSSTSRSRRPAGSPIFSSSPS